MLAQAAYQALKPEFHLRADRFYNAPDTEMDFTEQGGLMWGNNAVGKLVRGAEPTRPGIAAFVDEDAGEEVAEKVRRRLQHFIDRKVVAQFEPLLAMGRDEALQGLAKGFAFRISEAMGVMSRDAIAAEVKELDQESRGALRKHGIRFGQYTVFLPALLKPAPTRLRLVLWSLWNGLSEFPESPPPGLVTIPNIAEVPKMHYTLAGYHPSGARAIRIDMLERLADILRTKDSRAGFEATPDMLSITGMTLDQFVDLMGGLGYKGEKGERAKVKTAPVVEVKAEEPASLNPVPEEVSLINPVVEEPVAELEAAAEAAPELETYFTFTWAPKPRARPERPARPERSAEPRADRGPRPDRGPRKDAAPVVEGQAPAADGAGAPAAEPRPRREGGYKGNKPRDGQGEGRSDRKPRPKDGAREGGRETRESRDGGKPDAKPQRSFEARPPRVEKPIDPDNPFAVLAALKLQK